MASRFQFQTLTEEDLSLVQEWLETSHVRAWFGDPDKWFVEIKANLGEKWIQYYRADTQGEPTGFCQVYDARRAKSGTWPSQPIGTTGIDFFLGEADALGHGLGTYLVEDFVRFIRGLRHPPRIVADPDPENVRSIRALRHAGFTRDPESGLYMLGHT